MIAPNGTTIGWSGAGFLASLGKEDPVTAVHDTDCVQASRPIREGNGTPLVSIGMPVYNGMPHIQQALDSLVHQSYPNLEIIISDDYSTDGTYEVCERFARQDPRITLVGQTENLGMWRNFQCVFDRSQGRYFMWASQDDIWDRDWIRQNLRAFTPGAIATFGSFCTIDQQGGRVHAFPDRIFSENRYARSLQVMYSHMTGVLMYGLFDRALLSKVPGFRRLENLGLYADNVFLLLVAASGRLRGGRSSVLWKRVPVDGGGEVFGRSLAPRKVARVLRETATYCGHYLDLDLSPGMRALMLLNTVPFYLFLLGAQWRGTVYERRNTGRRQ